MARKHVYPVCGNSLTVLGQETNKDSAQFVHEDHRNGGPTPVYKYDAFSIGEFLHYREYNDNPENSEPPGTVFFLTYFTSSDQTLIDSGNFLSEENEDVSISTPPSFYLSDGYVAKKGQDNSGSYVSRIFDGTYKALLKQHGEAEIPMGSVFTIAVKSAKTSDNGTMFRLTLDYNIDGTNQVQMRSAGKWITFMVVGSTIFGQYNLVPLGSNNWV